MYDQVAICVAALFGLLVGSFLNVVIARMPKALKRDWLKQCHEFIESPNHKISSQHTHWFRSLVTPRSHCPKCKTLIHAYDNIPVISYLLLRGRCRHCKKHISLQYPCIEGLTAILCAIVTWRFGITEQALWQTLAGCALTCVLIVQATIDCEHLIIPDEITLPVLWLGMILSLQNIFTSPYNAVIGACSGYLVLWGIYWLFYICTKKEGMGYGDFKLLAMLGAWLGWKVLPFIIVFSSAVGSIVGVSMILLIHKNRNQHIPFGPFIAAGGWVALIWGSNINNWYLNLVGLY